MATYDIEGPKDYKDKPNKPQSMSEVAYLLAQRLCKKGNIKDFDQANLVFQIIAKNDQVCFQDSKGSENDEDGKSFQDPIELNNKKVIYFDKNCWRNDSNRNNWSEIEKYLKSNNKYIIIKDHQTNTAQLPQNESINNLPLQLIRYGAPGTGKSWGIINEKFKDITNYIELFRTTFHPDTDYSTFVGCYKPKMEGKNIEYKFVPQIFIRAYLKAWEEFINETNKHVFLIIEEINRGGCAQIFGDIFQLLDRDDERWSQYVIIPDQDIIDYINDLKDFKIEEYKGKIAEHYKESITDNNNSSGIYLAMPPNFHIWATMNTSDQSLFPMDSAFKRRWEWEYVRINPENEKVNSLKILVNNHEYEYPDFINKINSKIKSLLKSADKQIGEFFVRSKNEKTITFKDFRDKVLFYLFNDVFKDNKEFRKEFSDGNEFFLFEDLINIKDENEQERIVSIWLNKWEVKSDNNSVKDDQGENSQDSETEDTDNQNEL